MIIKEEDKGKLLKTISDIIKKFRETGPEAHYIKYYDNQIDVYVINSLTKVEKYLFNNFGAEYYKKVRDYYEQAFKESVEMLNDEFYGKYRFTLLDWNLDYQKDVTIISLSVVTHKN